MFKSNRSLQSLSKEVDAVLAQKTKLKEERTLLNKELQLAVDNFDWLLQKEKLLIELENIVSQVKVDILNLQKQCFEHNRLHGPKLKS